MDEELRHRLRGYVLKNAVKHGGKAKLQSVLAMIFADMPGLRPQARRIVEVVRSLIDEVNKLGLDEQKRVLEAEYSWLAEERREERERALPPLPGAREGEVRLRFAPNPDFAIHLGNARPAILSSEYAKLYKGSMILRFEDTDPRTKPPMVEAYEMIREDLKWLGVHWDEEHIQSLRMSIYYDVARSMLARGCSYIDVCGGKSRALLREGKYCESRDRGAEWQLEEFDKMVEGAYGEGEAVVRVKTDPRHPNPSVRDWVALRIIDTERHPHPLVGSKYVVWPTYNYAVSVDDHLMGVTHVLRGREHEVNTVKQLYIYKCMGWEPPEFIHLGRLKLEGFILSKSKIRELLEREPEKFMGIDDPRFGTISGLRRRGILPESIRRLILDIGVRQSDATISWVNLASLNRSILDPRADRIMYVRDPVRVELETDAGCLEARIPYHPERPEDVRPITVCPGEGLLVERSDYERGRVRLMALGNVSFRGGKAVVESLSLEEARRQALQVVQWVPEKSKVELTVLEPRGLDMAEHRGFADPGIKEYGVDSRVQLIRFGFARIDSVENGVYKAILTHK